MSPSSPRQPGNDRALAATRRLLTLFGARVHEERVRRHWSLRELATRARLSAAAVQSIEAGSAGSIDSCARLADALGLRLEFDLVDPRKNALASTRSADIVHSAMGELEAGHFHHLGHPVAMDEPYQHFQFAGRADVVAWNLEMAALLHIENRTRFPDFQAMAGAFGSKKAYLGRALAERLGVRGWRSETHVMVALWSSEVLHVMRLRTESFRAICPDPPTSFMDWWRGNPPIGGKASTLVVLDPLAIGRQRLFVGLDDALIVRPRYRGYADVAQRLAHDHDNHT